MSKPPDGLQEARNVVLALSVVAVLIPDVFKTAPARMTGVNSRDVGVRMDRVQAAVGVGPVAGAMVPQAEQPSVLVKPFKAVASRATKISTTSQVEAVVN